MSGSIFGDAPEKPIEVVMSEAGEDEICIGFINMYPYQKESFKGAIKNGKSEYQQREALRGRNGKYYASENKASQYASGAQQIPVYVKRTDLFPES